VPDSALILRVPQAEALVGELRLRFDETAALGMPAHVTILAPFMPPQWVTLDVVRQLGAAIAAVPAFRFALTEVRRWPTVTYLAPEPAAPLVELTRQVMSRFPAFAPYDGRHGEIVAHLTVADGDADGAALAEGLLRPRLRESGPIDCECHELELLEQSDGRWQTMHTFALGGQAVAQTAASA
jgi:hypothetical protein